MTISLWAYLIQAQPSRETDSTGCAMHSIRTVNNCFNINCNAAWLSGKSVENEWMNFKYLGHGNQQQNPNIAQRGTMELEAAELEVIHL